MNGVHTKVLLGILLTLTASLLHAQSAENQYQKNCKKCHGENGKGHTMVGRMVKASDLTSDAVTRKSDADLAEVISKGKGKMPAFSDKLGGDAGVSQILNYVRSMKK